MEKRRIPEILDSIKGLTVEAAPKIIKEGVSIEEAEALKAKLK